MFGDDTIFNGAGAVFDESPRLSEFDPPGVFPPQKEAPMKLNFGLKENIQDTRACNSPERDESAKENTCINSFNLSPEHEESVWKNKASLSPVKVTSSEPLVMRTKALIDKDSENFMLPSRMDQLEREKREMLLQNKIREEKEKAITSENTFLQERVKKLEMANEKYEKDLSKSRQENFELKTEKDNLVNEVRKLTRQNGQAEGQSLWGQMTSASRELCKAEEEIKTLNRDILEAREKNAMLMRQQEKSEIKEKASERTLQELIAERKRKTELEEELESSLKDNAALSGRLADIDASFASYRKESEGERDELKHQLATCREEISSLGKSLRETQMRVSSSSSEYDEDGELHPRKRRLSDISQIDDGFDNLEVIADLKKKLMTSEMMRRKLHNKIQDLRGNVRVFVRCRPFLSSDEVSSTEESCVRCNAEGTTVSLSEHCSRGSGQVFQFDNVYNQHCDQEDVFDNVKDLIQSALDGYRVCVFSYGQTGSGKTHTMTGDTYGESRGLIPRSIELIIAHINRLKEDGWDVNASYSMVEVYNEALVDLLDPDAGASHTSQQSRGSKLKIMMQHDRVVVQNLTSVPLASTSIDEGMDQLRDILKQTEKARTTASTAMNERSSRSHVLFMMDLTCIHQDGTVMQGGLRLVDLAGSERLDRTGTLADATRLRETVNINKSLSCLGDVFMALGHKSSHVPYRNSKLTMLLQVI